MGRVLVIYEDEAVRQTLGKILELDAHCVTLAADGEHGFPQLQRQNFDLIVCDVKNDSAAMSQLRRLCKDRPLISILESGDPPRTTSEFAATRALAKPFQGADLLTLVRELIG
jgi:CheY-like chemotaxis protein